MRILRPTLIASLVFFSSLGVASSTAPSSERIEPGVLEATAPIDVLIRFDGAVPNEVLAVDGLDVRYRFGSVPALSATATPAALRALAEHPSLVYLEADKPIGFDLDTATIASRTKDVVDPTFDPSTPPVAGPDGEIIDGSGIGIAIVDTGLDGLHPDYQDPGKIGANYLIVPTGPVSSPNTALTHHESSAHGTHVAGIAVGTGAFSAAQGGPVYEGVAPGATVYAFNIFAAAAVSSAAIAFDWILRFGAEQDPPIKIVNNSWHCASFQCRDPRGGPLLHITLASQLAENGIVVTWAAGNDQGDGVYPTTNLEARNRTPGIIGVANYKDDGWNDPSLPPGTRNGCLSSNSAWGASNDPETWPDVAAPGRSIMSTWAFGVDRTGTAEPDIRNPVTNEKTYKSQSGTSMSAPHVAGLAALMLQANPTLSPADIEYIVKQTATPLVGPSHEDGCGIDYLRADPSHPWHAANYAAGHGLVHGYDAVRAAIDFQGIPTPIDNEVMPDDFILARPGIEADHVLFLSSDDDLTSAYPATDVPRAQPMEPNVLMTFRSDPIAEDLTFDGLLVLPFIGTTGEAFAAFNPPKIKVDVWVDAPSGARELLATRLLPMWQIYPKQPVGRDYRFTWDGSKIIPAGHRVRLVVGIISPPLSGIDPPPEAFWTLYWEQPFGSRIEFGRVVEKPHPASRAGCEARQDCAMLDATHVYETMDCGPTVYDLTLHGPPGSSLIFSCEGSRTACIVPGLPGDPWGTCEAQFETTEPRDTYKAGVCMYRMPDNGRGAIGKCVGHALREDDR